MNVCGRVNTGIVAQLQAQEEAELGSVTLERECRKVIRAFAHEHHIRPDEARILLLDTGVRL